MQLVSRINSILLLEDQLQWATRPTTMVRMVRRPARPPERAGNSGLNVVPSGGVTMRSAVAVTRQSPQNAPCENICREVRLGCRHEVVCETEPTTGRQLDLKGNRLLRRAVGQDLLSQLKDGVDRES